MPRVAFVNTVEPNGYSETRPYSQTARGILARILPSERKKTDLRTMPSRNLRSLTGPENLSGSFVQTSRLADYPIGRSLYVASFMLDNSINQMYNWKHGGSHPVEGDEILVLQPNARRRTVGSP